MNNTTIKNPITGATFDAITGKPVTVQLIEEKVVIEDIKKTTKTKSKRTKK